MKIVASARSFAHAFASLRKMARLNLGSSTRSTILPAEPQVMFTLGVGTLDIVALLFPLILRLEKPEWLQYWHGLLGLNAALAFLFSGWFLLGGLHDLSRFFSQLERAVRDYGDDGSSAWAQRARAECGVEAVGATATAHGLPAAENAINLEQVVATERKGLLAGEATRCERLRSDDAMEEASATVPSDAARA
eukprot:SAG31_NODE_903_length_11121_cov_10.117311_4_plen_193_part_00